jgi:signal transduction histidine kinase
MQDLQLELDNLLKRDQTLPIHLENDKLQLSSDKNILRNILYNLLSNAIKYSSEGKTIQCSIRQDGLNVEFEIIDEGIGIPSKIKAYRVQVFPASNAVYIPGTAWGSILSYPIYMLCMVILILPARKV